jgi:arylformamidase
MIRLVPFLFAILTVVPALGAEGERVQRNIAYSDAGGDRTRLDVYSPGVGKDHPLVIWIHGRAWKFGDKTSVQAKPKAFNELGYVLVSINYRFHPVVTYKEQAGDTARAIHWVHEHARDFGGDPSRVFLIGHSAGAHLAALVGTDGHYLKNDGLKLSDLSGVILLDGAGYDIPRQIQQAMLPRLKTMYKTVFGENETKQKDASPITHVAGGIGIPPFLILHVASRRDSKAQSEGLAAKLRGTGVEANVVPAEGKTHATINGELGQPDNPPTKAVFEFLRVHCQKLSPK